MTKHLSVLLIGIEVVTLNCQLALIGRLYRGRLERLILVMAIAMIWAVFSGLWDATYRPLPYEKSGSQIKKLIAA